MTTATREADVKKQARALFAFSTESVGGQAYWLARGEQFDSYTWFESYVPRLEAVTVDDVWEYLVDDEWEIALGLLEELGDGRPLPVAFWETLAEAAERLAYEAQWVDIEASRAWARARRVKFLRNILMNREPAHTARFLGLGLSPPGNELAAIHCGFP